MRVKHEKIQFCLDNDDIQFVVDLSINNTEIEISINYRDVRFANFKAKLDENSDLLVQLQQTASQVRAYDRPIRLSKWHIEDRVKFIEQAKRILGRHLDENQNTLDKEND